MIRLSFRQLAKSYPLPIAEQDSGRLRVVRPRLHLHEAPNSASIAAPALSLGGLPLVRDYGRKLACQRARSIAASDPNNGAAQDREKRHPLGVKIRNQTRIRSADRHQQPKE